MTRNIFFAAALALTLSACSHKQEVAYTVPEPSDVMMYQVNPRVFASEKSFNAIVPQLDSIRSLGTNVVWFMPIYETGQLNGKNSPYCIKNYTALNDEFGTIDEFKNLIAECHKRGMAVIADWVANHTSWDNAWVTEHPDWYTQDAEGNIIYPEGTNWEDVADLNFDNAEMRLAMIDAMKWWVDETGIDGFRCDAADFVPFEFWKQAVDSLRAIPDRKLLLLAEGNRKDHFDAGFEMNYAWNFMGTMRDIFVRDSSAAKVFATDIEEYDSIPEGCVKLRFTTNHDEATKLSPTVEFGNVQGSLSAFVISTFIHGGALIYGSQEVAYPDTINFFHYVPVDWNANPEVRETYRRLMKLYNEHPAIRKGVLGAYPDENVVVFTKSLDGEEFLIVASVRNAEETVAVPEAWGGSDVTDMMNGTEGSLADSLTLKPYEYHIFKK